MRTAAERLTCGDASAGRLAPYDPKVSENFEIPIHIGKLIAAWDRPLFVRASEAAHMRDDDYVVGLGYKGQFRAYPLWITDNYHIINDRIAGVPVLFATCERCQSGSAFISKIGDQAVRFSAMGMYNASLTMINRRRSKDDAHSLWLHYEGVAIDGPKKGHFLEQIPTYHMTWRRWRTAHPETDVMLPPEDPHHRDARHGHGREEIFSRPGMDPPLAKTITGRFDHRYPENEMVLGINIDAGIRAYPLLEVKRQGGVVTDMLGQVPLVVFCGPESDAVTMSAFSRIVSDRVLTFERSDEHFRDQQTGSEWTIEGKAVSGPLAGRQLRPVRWQYVRWHAWVYPHPETELFRSSRPPARFPELPSCRQVDSFREILDGLTQQHAELALSHVVPELALPQEAVDGLCVYVGDDRFNLYRFSSPVAAADYIAFKGAWFCMPFDAKIGRKRAIRIDSVVFESDPVDQYAEPTQTVRYPDNEVPWSGFLHSCFPGPSEPNVEGYFEALINHLRLNRYDVVEVAFLPRSQQRPGTVSAISATIEADRFAIYRCSDEVVAAQVAAEVGHAIQEGSLVLRSIPVLMYADPHYEMGQLPDEDIQWSSLLDNHAFKAAVKAFVGNHPVRRW